jgi:hypothetical protein
MSPTLRQDRDHERVRRAAAAARANGEAAMGVALAQIGTAFDEAAAINAFKIRVEEILRLGRHHPALRARFGVRAGLLSGRDLNEAIVIAERWWRDERKAFQIASALGYGIRLSLEVLRELRLMLRLMRFKRMEMEFYAAINVLRGERTAVAAG